MREDGAPRTDCALQVWQMSIMRLCAAVRDASELFVQLFKREGDRVRAFTGQGT